MQSYICPPIFASIRPLLGFSPPGGTPIGLKWVAMVPNGKTNHRQAGKLASTTLRLEDTGIFVFAEFLPSESVKVEHLKASISSH